MNQLVGDGQDVRKAIETLRASAKDLREQSRKDDDPRASRLMLDMANEVDGVADELEDSFCPDDHETLAEHDQPPVDGGMGGRPVSEPQRLDAVFEGGDVKAAMALFREMTEAILRNPASSERSVMTARFMKLAFPPFIDALEQLKGDACGNTEHVVDVATHCIAQCLANLFGTLVPLDRNWDAVADLLRRTSERFASMSEKMMNLNADRKAAH